MKMQKLRPLVLGLALSLCAGAVQATPQFTPTPTAQLHTQGSGQPGAEWDTGGLGAGGQISYDQGTGLLSMTAGLNTMNWWDPSNGSCATDSGSNCTLNFGPDLDITLTSSLDSLTVTPVSGTIVSVSVVFGTTGGWDVTVTDPADGSSTQLQAAIASGTFNGNPTSGITAQIFYDTSTNQAVSSLVSAAGFMTVDGTTPFASLFQPDYVGINISAISNFVGAGGGLNEILTSAVNTGVLPSFTAEANGQIFKTAAGQFVPEPGSAMLLALGLLALARRRAGT